MKYNDNTNKKEIYEMEKMTYGDLVLIMCDDGPLMGFIDGHAWEKDDQNSFIMRNPVVVLFQNEQGPDGQQGVSISLKGFMPYPIGRIMDTNALVEISMSEVKNLVPSDWIDPSLKTAYNNQFNQIRVANSAEMDATINQVPNPVHIVKN